jgi:MFS family permease
MGLQHLLILLLPISFAWCLPKSAVINKFLTTPANKELNTRPYNQFTKLQQALTMNRNEESGGDGASDSLSASPYRLSIVALLVAAFLNLLGFTMAGPITPALGQHFELQVGASFGSLTSAYPLGMLCGLFLWPTLSDSMGRPPVIALSLLGTGLGLALQSYVIASNKSLSLFLLSRVITGSFAGSSPVSKAYIADVAGPNLPRYLAWRDAASTLAFLVGPLLGGIVYSTSTSLDFVIRVSALASLAAAGIVGLMVKNEKDAKSSEKQRLRNNKFESSDLVSCPLGTSLWGGVVTVCFVSFLFNVGDSTFHAFFSALLKKQELSAHSIGLAYTGLAALSFTISTTLASPALRKVGPVLTCFLGLFAVALGLGGMGIFSTASLFDILACAGLYYCGVPLYSPTIPTMLLRCVPPNKRGFILGLDGAINTIARILSPLIMGILYASYGPTGAFGVAGATTFVAATTTLVKRFVVLRAENIPDKKQN